MLAPAGDIEKLKAAVFYGADAAYMAGHSLGLRANAKNFDSLELEKGIKFAHSHGVKVYITANIFAHNSDFIGMSDYFRVLSDIGADALIISDPGVFLIARESVPNMPIHISTQSNSTNTQTGLFWQKLGAKRIVLARELSLNEITEITSGAPEMEFECFSHGAMCISYSGRCLLSGYMTGRDSNRGDCAQPCRWKYSIVENTRPGEYMPIEEDERGTYIFNSKDLCMIEHLDKLLSTGVKSIKIEGRMKSPYYVATIVKAYRNALDDYYQNPSLYESKKDVYLNDIKKASHRDFTTGFFFSKPDGHAQNYGSSSYVRGHTFLALVLDYKDNMAKVEQRNKFCIGDEIEVFRKDKDSFTQIIDEMYDLSGSPISEAPHAQQILYVKLNEPVTEMDMIRKKIDE